MPDLKYGLNLTKKPGLPPLSSRPPPKKTIFDDDSDSDSNDNPPPAASAPPKRKANQISQYGDLSARHTSIKHAQAAQELDSSVYDYDGVYDSLHAKPAKAKDSSGSGPKYMTSLLAAAEVRKRDQLRAKEKALQREREEEGQEFADKEKFVTGAYKAQQAEMERVEREEREREAKEMEGRRKGGGGMVGLYKELLGREDERHERAMRAVDEAASGEHNGDKVSEEGNVKDETTLAKEKGATVNEDGQIVDKRQLLTAGLNVAKKSKAQEAQNLQARKEREQYAHRPSNFKFDGKRDARERQTRMLEDQLAEASKKAAEEEQAEKKALEKANKRRVTEKDVSSAKERYLARKRAAEEEKKKAS